MIFIGGVWYNNICEKDGRYLSRWHQKIILLNFKMNQYVFYLNIGRINNISNCDVIISKFSPEKKYLKIGLWRIYI